MGNTLFDNFNRTYDGPANYTESEFDYLNKSAREGCENARKCLDLWFREYCIRYPSAIKDFKGRFCSQSDEQHLGAITELYLHNFLLKSGYNKIENHPETESAKHPEFLVLDDGKPLFFAEAAMVYGRRDRGRVKKFEATILDSINTIESQNFLILVEIESVDSNRPPSTKKIKECIEKQLNCLDYCEVLEKDEEQYPKWEYRENNWKLNFIASPIEAEARHYQDRFPSRNIGSINYPIKQIELDEEIKETVSKKSKKYGNLRLPFIIVLNVISDSIFYSDEVAISALFGKRTVQSVTDANGTRTIKQGRTFDGIIVHPGTGIQNTKMSGLLIMKNLTSFTLENVKPVLWHHPKAKYPFDVNFLKDIDHKIYNPSSGKMEDKMS
ncbi:MAG: hypothetical protein WC445_00385 [Patescibacteria group bacterium]